MVSVLILWLLCQLLARRNEAEEVREEE